MRCPLCASGDTEQFVCVGDKRYYRCAVCDLRFLDRINFLSSEDEYAHYLHHENNVDDLSYRRFLSKLSHPLLSKLSGKLNGLDYGCGPGPALAQMLEEEGHSMSLFDPYFHNEQTIFSQQYDFVVCSETAEHFHHPAKEFSLLDGLLKPGGWLGVMTCFQSDDEAFAHWHYRRDPTHVVFYRAQTFKWLARHFGWTCEIVAKDVVLLQKSMG